MDLHLDLDATPGRSLRARCEHALRATVRRLPAGTRLAPTRALAAELGVSRGVVVEAYAQLAAEGYLLTRRGGGTLVAGERGGAIAASGGAAAHGAPPPHGLAAATHGASPPHGLAAATHDASPPHGLAAATHGASPPHGLAAATHGESPPHGLAAAAPTLARPPKFDLRPALPALDGAFRPAWARALGRALRTTADARFGYPDPRGEPELREALAASLARRRGVQATAAEVLVTGGLGPSLPFVWRLLADRGIRRVAIEDPCWPRLEATLIRAGLEPVRVAVDADGADTPALDRLDVDAIFVTPAHQYPTGAVLSPARRAALIDWARNPNPQVKRGQSPLMSPLRFVIEDDYDAEFRYDRQPVGSLQGLAPDVVIYGGSTSKTLAPGLRLGWLVLPPGIEADAPAPPPVLDQLALADLITRGDFDRHLRRHRRLYQRRREALLEALAERLPELTVSGAAAGLHFVLHLPPQTDEKAAVEAARAQGIALDPLRATKPGLVVGYANLPEALAPAAVEALATTLE